MIGCAPPFSPFEFIDQSLTRLAQPDYSLEPLGEPEKLNRILDEGRLQGQHPVPVFGGLFRVTAVEGFHPDEGGWF